MTLLPWRDVKIDDGPAINTSLTQEESSELARLCRNRTVLEIGSAFGYSAIVMATCGAKHVTAVDPHNQIRDSLPIMRAHLSVYGVADMVRIVPERSTKAMEEMQVAGRRFDLIFIDGDHSRQAVTEDYQAAMRLLSETGGIIACHDYGEDTCPGVREALDALAICSYCVGTLWIKEYVL